MSWLGLSSAFARRVILWAQGTRYKGSGDYSVKASLEQGASAPFPQAESEAADCESFFGFFPDYLAKDALRGKTVLDFGSGYGGRTVEYKLCGAVSVCGVEPFESMVALSQRYAEHRGVTNVEFRVCGHREIPYPDSTFDVVISYDVLEHVEDPRAAMNEIRRVLRPGGLSINVFPVYFGARSHHLDYVSNVPGLHWLFSARALVRAVNSILAEKGSRGALHTQAQPEPHRSFDGARDVLPQLNGLSSWHLKDLFREFETVSLDRHALYWWEPGRGRVAKAVARARLPMLLKDAATSSMSCILRKPGPQGSVPLPTPETSSSMAQLTLTDWTLSNPARLADDCIIIRGAVSFGQAYVAISPVYRLPRGGRVTVAGRVRRGGMTLGLLNRDDQFATQVAIPPGTFRRFVDAPAAGSYRIVIASNLSGRQARVDVEVSEVGLVDLDPAEHRVRSEITWIKPLEDDAWDAIHPPARRDGHGLRIVGEPASASAYAAKSARYYFPKGTLVAAAGTVQHGGIVLGLLDGNDHWAATATIGEGKFRNGVEVPLDGEYRIVIVNNLSSRHRSRSNDVEISEIGLVERDPAECRVGPPEIGQITPFGVDDWDLIHPPTRCQGHGLHLTGKPSSVLTYAAESVTYRLPKGAIVGVAGMAREGRIMLGLLDSNQAWAATTLTRGTTFLTGIEVPRDGEYRIILANDFSAGQSGADVEVHEIGLVGLVPAQHRVGSARRAATRFWRRWRRT